MAITLGRHGLTRTHRTSKTKRVLRGLAIALGALVASQYKSIWRYIKISSM